MEPRISVIVVAYNRREFLLDALRSISNQTFKNYEVIVTKNFQDKVIDDFIKKHNFREIFIDTKRYGEKISAAVEDAKGDIISFLEDDDEFFEDKLAWVNKGFNKRNVSYFHDTRIIINKKGEPILPKDPKYVNNVKFFNKITPHYDIIIDPKNREHIRLVLRYYDIISAVSLMSAKAECITSKLKYLKSIDISIESFIPVVAAECGLLYHTSQKLTKYRIHSYNSSIGLDKAGNLRLLLNLRRAINDHELVINMSSTENGLRYAIKMFELDAKLNLSVSKYMRLFDVSITPQEIIELCRLKSGYINRFSFDFRVLTCTTKTFYKLL
ncbi:MAG: glycosyltransferase [Candidatus Nanopusillus sp.]